MLTEIKKQAESVIKEFIEGAELKEGSLVVIGCSTSEIIGSKIGSNTLQHSGKNKRNYCGGLRVKIIFSTYKHGDCFPLG